MLLLGWMKYAPSLIPPNLIAVTAILCMSATWTVLRLFASRHYHDRASDLPRMLLMILHLLTLCFELLTVTLANCFDMTVVANQRGVMCMVFVVIVLISCDLSVRCCCCGDAPSRSSTQVTSISITRPAYEASQLSISVKPEAEPSISIQPAPAEPSISGPVA
jgi:hypothetical protein